MRIAVDPELKADDAAVIRDRLFAYNDDQVDGTEGHIGVLLKDDDGTTVGGLTGHWYYSWLFVDIGEPARATTQSRMASWSCRIFDISNSLSRYAHKGEAGVWFRPVNTAAMGQG